MGRRRSFAESLSVLAFAILGLSLVHDAFAAITCRSSTGQRACTTGFVCPVGWQKISNSCSTQTVGGSITYITHHGKAIKCTWQEFQGEWTSDPGDQSAMPPVPISVSQQVIGDGNYATCSGWNLNDTLPPLTNHEDAPYGFGKFHFRVEYQSAAPLTCTEDANAGIGNNCTKADAQNPKHKPSGGTATPGASRACKNLSGGGTELTYQFACADGVAVTGFLTLVPVVNNSAQTAPNFTGPCSAARVAAGECTMQLGGIPTKTVKGKNGGTVVDDAACLAAFPGSEVPNALNTTQSQILDPKEILFYQEVASEGSCVNTLPTVVGLPSAAYGLYCQSDLGPLPEFGGAVEGFDNVLRVCPVVDKVIHTAAHDVEQVQLGGNIYVEYQPTLNLNCTSGSGNNDSGIYKVWIPDLGQVRQADIDISPLSDAPKLEGVAPFDATPNVVRSTDPTQFWLELKYKTCPQLSAKVIANNGGVTNNSNVTLHLNGQIEPKGLGPVLFNSEFVVKVNGL